MAHQRICKIVRIARLGQWLSVVDLEFQQRLDERVVILAELAAGQNVEEPFDCVGTLLVEPGEELGCERGSAAVVMETRAFSIAIERVSYYLPTTQV